MCALCYICRVSSCGVHVRARGYRSPREVECEGWKWKNCLPKTAAPQTGMGHFYTQESGMECIWSGMQSHWSLSVLGNKPKKFDFVHETISRWDATQAGHETTPTWALSHLVSFPDPQQDSQYRTEGLGMRLYRVLE